jgi:hypothetical protein
LGFDEFVAIFLALGTIGAILLWSLSRQNEAFRLPTIVSSPSPIARSTPIDPNVTASPVPETQLAPIPLPIPSPEVLSPVPSSPAVREPIPQAPAIVPLPAPVPEATTPVTPAPTDRATNFIDVPGDFWAYPFITALANRGIVNGFPGGYFKPTDPVTRAEFAALLQEAFNQNPGQGTINAFKDVSSDFWAVPAINRAIQTGFLRGYPDSTFQPQQEIPRVEVLVALASGLNLAPPALPQQVVQSFYQDAAEIPNYATEKVAAASTSGLVVNYPNQKLLNPNQNATRAEVAAMMYQALAQSGKLEPIQSPYIAGVQEK